MVGGEKEIRDGTRLPPWRVLALAVVAVVAIVLVGVTLAGASSGLTVKPVEHGLFTGGAQTIEGTSADNTDPIKVKVHVGSSSGPPVAELETTATGGAWSVNTSLGEGEYTAVATQTEGTESSSAEATFGVDTEAPAVTVSSLSSTRLKQVPHLEGKGESASWDEGPLVIVYKGTKAGGEIAASSQALSTSGGAWGYTPPASGFKEDGPYTVQATQQDGAARVGSSEEVTFTIDRTAPHVTMGVVTTPTKNRTPTLGGEAGTEEGDQHFVTVTIHKESIGGQVVGIPHVIETSGSSTWSFTTPTLEDNTYVAEVTQEDSAGNVGHEARTFTVKTSAPGVGLEVPASGAVLGSSPVAFSGPAGNASEDSGTVTLKIYNGGSASGPAKELAVSRNGGSWKTSEALEDGTYTAQATQEDSLHNLGTSEAHTFKVKASTPVVTLSGPSSVSANSSPEFSGKADNREGNNQQVTLKIYPGEAVGGKPQRTLHTNQSNGAWSIGPVEPLGDGTYTAQAEQEDIAGHSGQSAPVTFTIDATPPKPTLVPLAKRIKDSTPTLEGTRGTQPHDEASITLTVYEGGAVGGHVVGTPETFGVSGSHWSFTLPSLGDGTYTVQASQKNEAGKEGGSEPVTFTVDTRAPHVTLDPVRTPSNNATPTLTGEGGTESGDGSQVTVTIYENSKPEGEFALSGKAGVSGGRWSFPSTHLKDGTYTALVEEVDEAGNQGHSEARTFTISTASPTVTLNSPAPISNNTTPSFSGTASDPREQVTVSVYPGSSAGGKPFWSATTPVSGGQWKTEAPVAPTLTNGEYTVIATQPSSLENAPGQSKPATFKVNTSAPRVILTQPTTPSNKTEPTFKGEASDTTSVVIKVYEGTGIAGKPVTEVSAAGTGGAWESTPAKLSSGSHTYTAIAYQKSSLVGNPEGASEPKTFIVETNSPTVTLSAPKTPSNSKTPAFSGTATDTTEVTVNIYGGSAVGGTPFTTAKAVPVAGKWTSGAPASELPEGTYTAQATQPSSLGNNPGVSEPPVKFIVDTGLPTVSIKPLVGKQPPAPPAFRALPELSGSAGTDSGSRGEARDLPTVTVKIYKGEAPGREAPALEATTTATSGVWSLKSSTSLVDGTYTAIATQSDELGNTGTSAPVKFIIDTLPPSLTLTAPPEHSNQVEPTFSGTTGDPTPVTITVYLLEKGKSQEYASATATPSGKNWSSGKLTTKLKEGRHTYAVVATQQDEAGNSTTTAADHFIVDTLAPTVTLSQPRSPTNERTPAFTGTASGGTEVTVKVYAANSKVPIGEAKAAGHNWTTGPLSAALPDGQYTAVAGEQIGEHISESQAVAFVVDTVAPHVTLNGPASGTGSSEQLSGTADSSDPDASPAVGVQLFSGSSIAPGQAPVQTVEVSAPGGRWSTTIAALSPGSYAVRAQQSDAAGNVGTSSTATFTLAGPAAAAPASPPNASFSWVPAAPHAGEAVSLVSNSTDASSPLTGFAWDLAGNGPFQLGGSVLGTSFATPGNHLVRLRVSDANGLTSVAAETIPVGAPAFVLLQPFPLVRIVSTRAGSGIKLSLLSILAAPGTHITITCKGHGCPMRRQSKLATSHKVGLASVSFRRFQRALPSGITLEIRVFKLGQVGKYTRLSVAHGKLRRSDSCLAPNGITPMSCPAP